MGNRKRRLTRAERNIEWINRYCLAPEGKHVGQPINLRPWQRKVIKGIYNTPTRRAIVSFGRKNGKTALAAMLLLLHLCGPEARPNSQLFSAAQSRDQASILFALAAKMIRLSSDLSHFVTIRDTAKQLFCADLGTLYRALSADHTTSYGLSPVFIVHDELGQVRGPQSALYEALETACGAQEEPLSVVISTQAPTDGDLLSMLIDDAKTGSDPKTKLFMYSASVDDNPFSIKAIRAANPAYGDFLNPDEVKAQSSIAERMPSRESAYRNLILNQRISQHSPFIPRATWMACGDEVDYSLFSNRPVYAGLDLSARNDLTALSMVAKDEEGSWHAVVEFFAPEDGVRDRAHRDRAPYDVWADKGLLTLTPGGSVDYAYVAYRIAEICTDFDIRAISFDRWRIQDLIAELTKIGVQAPLEPFGQGFKDMGPALDQLESIIANGKLRHGNNPILTWCAANAIAVADPAGNRKLDKVKSTGRIDGLVALVMAIGRTSVLTDNVMPYADHGLRVINMLDNLKKRLRASLAKFLGIRAQTSNMREPSTWLLSLLGSSETASGVKASQTTAYGLSPYYCGVRLISETLGSLPLNVYRRTNTRAERPGREVADSHPVHRLLHSEPNPYMTAMVFRELLAAHCIDHGNAYAEIVRDSNGFPTELWPLMPDRTHPRLTTESTLYYETWMLDGTPRILMPDQILHIPGLGWSGLKGYPLLQLAAESIGLHAAQRNYAGAYFKNGGHVSAVMETDGHLDDAAIKRLTDEVNKSYTGVNNAHRIALLEYGVKMRTLNSTHEDAQLIESMKFSIEEWARWFNVPPHKLKDLSNATFSNIEHQSIEWVTDSIRPWAIRFEQEFNRKLFFQKRVFYTKHVVDGLLRGDLKSRFDAYAVARNWGWMSANDIRELEDRDPLPGDIGDIYLSPMNMTRAEDVGMDTGQQAGSAAEPQPSDPQDPQEPQDPQDPQPAQTRQLKLVRDTARRVVNYESRRLERANEDGARWMVYNDGGLEHKIIEWLATTEQVAEDYVRRAEQLNLIADEQEIPEAEQIDAKVALLTSLVMKGDSNARAPAVSVG